MSAADSRSVHTDALATLGTIIDDKQKRDAIHLAVIPMIARCQLRPGQHVTKTGEPTATGFGVGIVDPFLPRAVETGERFWLVIYPRVITSLRHVWAHPAFEDEAETQTAVNNHNKAASEEWLRDFVARSDCPDYDTLMGAIRNGGQSFGEDNYNYVRVDGDYFHVNGTDASGEIPDEFWTHAEVVTGLKLSLRPSYFSCSC